MKRLRQDINWSWIQKIFDYDDNQLEAVKKSPQHLKWIKVFSKLAKIQMVAEVVESKNCMAQLQKGDKYYFKWGGYVLDKDKGAENVCLWAVCQLLPFYFMINDRISEGLNPNNMIVNHVRCYDVGFRGHCGYGEVLMKVYAQSE
ncbi:MAG: hypothetical protein JSV05_05995 [Candidatus Bathyarchaeota archaeon]|nr:MAG: hypothetical protein JSV05_05995 [Candidatus Bathyarchaeota archaeon]